MCLKWFANFHAGDFLLGDAPWLGRPVEVDSDQIETVIENSQHYKTQEIADILKIPKSIKLLVKMINVSYFMGKKHVNFLTNPIIGLNSYLFLWKSSFPTTWIICLEKEIGI